MQILQPEVTCSRNYRHISFYSESEDGLANISDSLKNKDSGHKSLATCIKKILGSNNYEIKVNPKFPHWFFKFSAQGKGNVNKFVKHLNDNCSTIENVEYYYQAVNGDFTSNKEAQKYAHEVIKKHLHLSDDGHSGPIFPLQRERPAPCRGRGGFYHGSLSLTYGFSDILRVLCRGTGPNQRQEGLGQSPVKENKARENQIRVPTMIFARSRQYFVA